MDVQHRMFALTHLNFLNGESTAGTHFGVVTDRGATHNGSDRTRSGTREHGTSFRHTVVLATELASGLVEPGANVSLPPFVEMGIRNHIISLRHF